MIEATIASLWFRKPYRARTGSLSARIAALMRAVRASSTLLLVMLAVLTAFSRCQNGPRLSSAVMTSAARLNAPIERLQPPTEIGRAACRERVCQYGKNSIDTVLSEKKKLTTIQHPNKP